MKKLFLTILVVIFISPASFANPPKDNVRSKFYDFNEQLIDGKIRRPTALYIDARERARFNRLLRLKRSFLPELFQTSKDRIFK